MNVIPASGVLDVLRKRVDGSHYHMPRSVVGVDLDAGCWIVEDDRESGVIGAYGYYRPLLEPIPAQPGWYVHARWSQDGRAWEDRLPIVAWQRPDPTHSGMGEPPLVLQNDREEGPTVVPANDDGLGSNVEVLGVHHREDKPEAGR